MRLSCKPEVTSFMDSPHASILNVVFFQFLILTLNGQTSGAIVAMISTPHWMQQKLPVKPMAIPMEFMAKIVMMTITN